MLDLATIQLDLTIDAASERGIPRYGVVSYPVHEAWFRELSLADRRAILDSSYGHPIELLRAPASAWEIEGDVRDRRIERLIESACLFSGQTCAARDDLLARLAADPSLAERLVAEDSPELRAIGIHLGDAFVSFRDAFGDVFDPPSDPSHVAAISRVHALVCAATAARRAGTIDAAIDWIRESLADPEISREQVREHWHALSLGVLRSTIGQLADQRWGVPVVELQVVRTSDPSMPSYPHARPRLSPSDLSVERAHTVRMWADNLWSKAHSLGLRVQFEVEVVRWTEGAPITAVLCQFASTDPERPNAWRVGGVVISAEA